MKVISNQKKILSLLPAAFGGQVCGGILKTIERKNT